MKNKVVVVLSCLIMFIPSLCYAVGYESKLLGILGGDIGSGARDLSNAGTVLCWSGDSTHMTAALWTENGGLEAIAGANGQYTYGKINNNGYTCGYDQHAGVGLIRAPDGALYRKQIGSQLYSINDNLTAVGFVAVAGPGGTFPTVTHDTYVWYADGTEVNLGGSSDLSQVNSMCINNNNVVAWSSLSYLTNNNQAYVWTGAGAPIALSKLNTDPLEIGVFVYDINDNGQILGRTGGHSVIWDALGNISVDLGLGEAWGINNLGQVVGAIDYQAVLWQPDGSIVNLGYGKSSVARAINDHGQIVGSVVLADQEYQQAVLWEPVPEPSSLVALACGLVGVLAQVRKRRSF